MPSLGTPETTRRLNSSLKSSGLGHWRLAILAIVGFMLFSGGCARLRLPAIDPSGACLFSPLPTTTGLALPGAAGEGCCLNCLRKLGQCDCLSRLGSCLTRPKLAFPTPAFQTPVDPPACATPGGACGSGNEPCVPSAPCAGSCADGPPAVLIGNECNLAEVCHLPTKGDRGCILLSPQKIVAPVGGEVVLLSGICGTDGYLQMNERLEWMLAPDSVGQFIEVSDDKPGVVGRMAGSKVRPEKRDPSYAIGVTSTKPMLITRGNNDSRDDVKLEKGQSWLTISSPSEGTSHVTVLAPDSECWDQRKATATIYWVDARWSFPSPKVLPAGQSAELTTRVNRATGGTPAAGWKVRYEILNPELASFAGTNDSSVVEVNVDDSGNATATIVPKPGMSGTVGVDMTIVRPGGREDNLPSLTLGQGQTFVTWSAPRLNLRAGGPETATFRTPFEVVANVSNPGDQTATNVRIDVPIPAGTKVVSADSFARVTPTSVSWEIGDLPPQTQLDLFMTLESESSLRLPFVARAEGLTTEATVAVDIFRPALSLKVEPVKASVEAGTPAQFNIDITNTGDRPLTEVTWLATGDAAMLHEGGDVRATNTRTGALQPGETWNVVVTFIPNAAGRRCVTTVATANGGQRATNESCVTAINPIPDTPRITVKMDGPDRMFVGGPARIYRSEIINEGRGVATNVRVTTVFDPQFIPQGATEGADTSQAVNNVVTWTIPRIDPGNKVELEVNLVPGDVSPSARVSTQAESGEGSRGEDVVRVRIESPTSPSDNSNPRSPDLPPVSPTPEVPGGPAPLRGTPPSTALPPPPARDNRSGQLVTSLVNIDNPVGVNDPIRYQLEITNDSDARDGQIDIQFDLPAGVKVVRVVPLTNPEVNTFDFNANKITLPYIRVLDPGETAEMILVLSSNQPQTFDLNVAVRSLNDPNGRITKATTTIVP
jgi:Domain of unknown function DUF11